MKMIWWLLTAFITVLVGCKKDAEDESAPSITFTATSGYAVTLPCTVTFTASSPGADNITWDFGDGTTGQGFTTQHVYTVYGNNKVKATAIKSGKSASKSKDIPITFHRKAVVKKLEVLQVPTLKPGGIDWDPGTLPDLSYKITFPGDTVYLTSAVLNNVESGSFNIIPPQGTYVFNEDVRLDVYDVDPGNVPDRELMGTVNFKFSEVVPVSSMYTDSLLLNNGALRVLIKFEFQL